MLDGPRWEAYRLGLRSRSEIAGPCPDEPDRVDPSVKSGSIPAPEVASTCRAEPPFGAAKGQEKGNAKSG